MSLREKEVFAPRRRQRRRPEREIQKRIVRRLRASGCLVAVTDAGAAYRAGGFFGESIPVGWPDVTGLLPGGRFLGVEVKSARGRQSAAQKQMQDEIESRGGLYILAYSIEDVLKAIEGADDTGC